MSNIHSLEPQAQGLIIFKTTFGDIELELFTKQCPKNARNFTQLCLDGYYEGTIFDRVERDFIAIGGKQSEDRNDLELGYAPDEFHSRLKFSRRGLMATANTEKNSNGPAFFFTLGPAPELQNKHTIFGRLKGNSVYCLVDLNECPVDDEMLPLSEKQIIEVVIVDNPFPELKPRLEFVRAFRKTDNTGESSKNDLKNEDYDYLEPKYDIKYSKKLSFYHESESEESDSDKQTNSDSNKPGSVSKEVKNEELAKDESSNAIHRGEESSIDSTMSESREEARAKKLSEIKEQIQKLKKQLECESATKIRTLTERKKSSYDQGSHNVTLESQSSSSKQSSVEDPDLTAQELRLATKKGRQRERETLELMERFKKKLKETSRQHSSVSNTSSRRDGQKFDANVRNVQEEDEDVNEDDDQHLDNALERVNGDDWLRHRFDDKNIGDRLAKDANTKGDDWYSIDDSRNPIVDRVESERARDYKSHSRSRNYMDCKNNDEEDNKKAHDHNHNRSENHRHRHRHHNEHRRDQSSSSHRRKSSGRHDYHNRHREI